MLLCRLSLDERVAICSSVGEEVLQESELRNLLDKKTSGITAYDGFEPSGRMHIAQVSSRSQCPIDSWRADPEFSMLFLESFGDKDHCYSCNASTSKFVTDGFLLHSVAQAGSQQQSPILSPMISMLCCLQGVLKALNVNKLTRCGVTFKFWYVQSLLQGLLETAEVLPTVSQTHQAGLSLKVCPKLACKLNWRLWNRSAHACSWIMPWDQLKCLEDISYTLRFIMTAAQANIALNSCRVADWHASLNNKMGGDLKKIQTVGNYFVEVWKAVGMEGLNEKVRAHLLLLEHAKLLHHLLSASELSCEACSKSSSFTNDTSCLCSAHRTTFLLTLWWASDKFWYQVLDSICLRAPFERLLWFWRWYLWVLLRRSTSTPMSTGR